MTFHVVRNILRSLPLEILNMFSRTKGSFCPYFLKFIDRFWRWQFHVSCVFKWIMRDYYELIKLYVLSNVPQIGIWSKTFQNSRTRSLYFEATNFGVWLEIQLRVFQKLWRIYGKVFWHFNVYHIYCYTYVDETNI